ncbi:Cyclic di-GMP phosphodiesterase YfgF [compost metagenome]
MKIDGSLIKNLDTDINSQVVVETIVDFAKKLKLVTVAEFVHNQAVYEKVKSLDIERVQGFYLGKPDKETID